MATKSHYDQPGSEYFRSRESSRGQSEQSRRARIFEPHIQPGWSVLDFGCGNGALLAALNCASRVGVEIGPDAAAEARVKGIEVHELLEHLRGRRFDAVISSHALEHVESPIDILRGAAAVLKPGGALLLLLPAESPVQSDNSHWYEEVNKHLFAWTPLTLGNLVRAAGFDIDSSNILPMQSESSRVLRVIRRLAPRFAEPAVRLRARLKWRYEIFLVARRS